MVDTTSAGFRQSLAETIAWCERQRIVAEIEESAEIGHRRALIEQAGRLLQKAHQRVKGKWWAELFEQRDYRRAMTLLDEADPSSIVPLKDQLRSKELKPERSLSEAPEDAREALVSKLVHERSVRLAALKQPLAVSPELEWKKGKLLLYVPEENLACGAAVYPSKGFFDADNVPPWDIWVHYSEKTLISWAPQVLVHLVSDGIDANPEGCIRWAE
jgi:hypothetical protein